MSVALEQSHGPEEKKATGPMRMAHAGTRLWWPPATRGHVHVE